MTLYLENLDDRTRQLMLDELEYDISHNQLHISPFLSGQGQRDYMYLIREAIQNGTDQTLGEALKLHRRINRTQPRRQPKLLQIPTLWMPSYAPHMKRPPSPAQRIAHSAKRPCRLQNVRQG